MAKQTDLQRLEQALKYQNIATTVLIILFLLQAVGFLYYTYLEFSKYSDEDYLVKLAEKRIKENYPELRKSLKKIIAKQAPALAEKLSKKFVASMPEARKEIEDLLNRYLDKALEKTTQFSKEKFRQLVRENKDVIRARYKDVKKLPKESTQFVLHLEKSIDKQMGVDIRKEAHEVLVVQIALNNKLERLRQDPVLLDPSEQMERNIVRILRTIQLREIGKIRLASADGSGGE